MYSYLNCKYTKVIILKIPTFDLSENFQLSQRPHNIFRSFPNLHCPTFRWLKNILCWPKQLGLEWVSLLYDGGGLLFLLKHFQSWSMHNSEHLFEGPQSKERWRCENIEDHTHTHIAGERVIRFGLTPLFAYGINLLVTFALQAQASGHWFSIISNWHDRQPRPLPSILSVRIFLSSLSSSFWLAIFNFHLTRCGIFSMSLPCYL